MVQSAAYSNNTKLKTRRVRLERPKHQERGEHEEVVSTNTGWCHKMILSYTRSRDNDVSFGGFFGCIRDDPPRVTPGEFVNVVLPPTSTSVDFRVTRSVGSTSSEWPGYRGTRIDIVEDCRLIGPEGCTGEP